MLVKTAAVSLVLSTWSGSAFAFGGGGAPSVRASRTLQLLPSLSQRTGRRQLSMPSRRRLRSDYALP